jgi:hypothetical protein
MSMRWFLPVLLIGIIVIGLIFAAFPQTFDPFRSLFEVLKALVLFAISLMLAVFPGVVLGTVVRKSIFAYDNRVDPKNQLDEGKRLIAAVLFGIIAMLVQMLVLKYGMPNWPVRDLFERLGQLSAVSEQLNMWTGVWGFFTFLVAYYFPELNSYLSY